MVKLLNNRGNHANYANMMSTIRVCTVHCTSRTVLGAEDAAEWCIRVWGGKRTKTMRAKDKRNGAKEHMLCPTILEIFQTPNKYAWLYAFLSGKKKKYVVEM